MCYNNCVYFNHGSEDCERTFGQSCTMESYDDDRICLNCEKFKPLEEFCELPEEAREALLALGIDAIYAIVDPSNKGCKFWKEV